MLVCIHGGNIMKVKNKRGYVYSIQYHFVWCVNCRYDILTSSFENSLIKILNKIASDNNFEILEINSNLSYIHLFINCSPQHYIPNIVKALKGVSARLLIKEYGNELKKFLYDGHLWSPSYFVATANENIYEQIQDYVSKRSKKC